MAVEIGDRYVRRQDAARGATANNASSTIGYDSEVIANPGFSYASNAIRPDTAGRYLAIYDLGQVDFASTRAVGTLLPQVNGVNAWDGYLATHRYLRNSGGAQAGASIGAAMLPLSANDDVSGAVAGVDAVGNYATRSGQGGALQLIRLNDGNFTEVRRTVSASEVGTSNINATRPWLDSSGTWTKITFNSEVEDDDALYPGSGGDLTLKANKKYFIIWGASISSTDSSRHTNVVRLSINGINRQSGSGYHRTTASQGPPVVGMYLHETGGSTESLFLEATHETEGGDAGTPTVNRAYVQVLELPENAEWVHADVGAVDTLTSGLSGGTWNNAPLTSEFRADGSGKMSVDSVNGAIQNDSGLNMKVLGIAWHRWDRSAGTSGARKVPWLRWFKRVGNFAIAYATAGAFNRGQQGGDDNFQAHYCSAMTTSFPDGEDLFIQTNPQARIKPIWVFMPALIVILWAFKCWTWNH